jgi:transcription elongation factor GreA
MKFSNTKETQYITQEGFDLLSSKIEEFEQEYKNLCKELAVGRTLKDMDEYAMQEKRLRLEFLDTEITRLKDKLQRSRIIENAPELSATQKIHLGSKVHLQSGDKVLSYILVSSIEADPLEGKISDESPLGSALLGKMANALVKVSTPRSTTSYKIVSIDSL